MRREIIPILLLFALVPFVSANAATQGWHDTLYANAFESESGGSISLLSDFTGPFTLNNPSGSSLIRLIGSGNDFSVGTTGSSFRILDGGTSRLSINSAGNIGIGTTSPASRLDVAGTVSSGSVQTSSIFSSTDLLNVDDDLSVSGNTNLIGTLNVDVISSPNLNVQGSLTVDDSLSVTNIDTAQLFVGGSVSVPRGTKLSTYDPNPSTRTVTGSCDPYTPPVDGQFPNSGSTTDAASCSTQSPYIKQESSTTNTCTVCVRWTCPDSGGSADPAAPSTSLGECIPSEQICAETEQQSYVASRVCSQPTESQSIQFNSYDRNLVEVNSGFGDGRIEAETIRMCGTHYRDGSNDDSYTLIPVPKNWNSYSCRRTASSDILNFDGRYYALYCLTPYSATTTGWIDAGSNPTTAQMDQVESCGW